MNDDISIEKKDFPIDWEQREFETAKALMAAFCANSHDMMVNMRLEKIADLSVSGARMLIEKYKDDNNKKKTL